MAPPAWQKPRKWRKVMPWINLDWGYRTTTDHISRFFKKDRKIVLRTNPALPSRRRIRDIINWKSVVITNISSTISDGYILSEPPAYETVVGRNGTLHATTKEGQTKNKHSPVELCAFLTGITPAERRMGIWSCRKQNEKNNKWKKYEFSFQWRIIPCNLKKIFFTFFYNTISIRYFLSWKHLSLNECRLNKIDFLTAPVIFSLNLLKIPANSETSWTTVWQVKV